MFSKFWKWYENNYHINLGITAGLFLLQIFHLLWLFSDVIWYKLFGSSLLHLAGAPRLILVLVDYTEIPALIAASLIYIDALRHKFSWKSLLFLIFLNSQWLHLFWITDEFVVGTFIDGARVALPSLLAWVAILIDYLELPVIYDTIKRFLSSKTKAEAARVLMEGN